MSAQAIKKYQITHCCIFIGDSLPQSRRKISKINCVIFTLKKMFVEKIY